MFSVFCDIQLAEFTQKKKDFSFLSINTLDAAHPVCAGRLMFSASILLTMAFSSSRGLEHIQYDSNGIRAFSG